jgi:branched-chain amino acid transport system substrate-binding protein
MAREFIRAFTGLGGHVRHRLSLAVGQRDLEALVPRFPASFDLLFYGGSFEGAAILRAMRAAGLHQLFAAGDGCWDRVNFLEPAGEAAMAGEGVLVLSATPEIGRVAGSQAFADRYRERFGPIGNYAVNSYDSARMLLSAIEQAAAASEGLPARCDVVAAMRCLRFEGVAYRKPVSWDEEGDNRAAVTALNVVEGGQFRQIAEVERSA